MKYMNEVLEKMNQLGIIGKPCSPNELNILQKLAGKYKLPIAYIEFMKIMGNGTTDKSFLNACNCFMYERNNENITEWNGNIGLRELLEENESELCIKDSDFEFYSWQGYAYAFFNLEEGDNPPVYFYIEGQPADRIIKIANSFVEFLINNLEKNIFTMSEVIPATEEEIIKIHKELIKFEVHENEVKDTKVVAGVDFQVFNIENKKYCICMIALVDYKTNKFIGSHHKIYQMPDINTYIGLDFCKIQLFILAYDTIHKNLKVHPDVYIFNNSQIRNDNHMDNAMLAGILIGKSTIGVFQDKKISRGNLINTDKALEITRNMTTKGSQIPIPLLYANRLAKDLRKKIMERI